MATYWCELAWIGDRPVACARITVTDGRIEAIEAGARAAGDDVRLHGLVLPGLANTHSHAFHRALRGRTHDRGGTFWTWRQRMYAVADRLNPDAYLALSRAAYAEMALAGVTCVGEFHYLHHASCGARYDDPNAMGAALVQAAVEAGVRLTLLDTCYLAGGIGADGHTPPDGVQRRFSDGTALAWAERVASLPGDRGARPGHGEALVGAAIHSVRAVPADQLEPVVEASAGRPLHVHLSEQPAENEACRRFYGCSPTALLADRGVLGGRTTAVHATHLTRADVVRLGVSGTTVCACPSTEADLADGIGGFRWLHDAGVRLCVGTDQHASSDLLTELQLLEGFERLASGERGRFSPAELVDAATVAGHASLGWPDAGHLDVGAWADLVAVSTDSPRTAGMDPAQVALTATAADVRTVVCGGRVVVDQGHHMLGDVGRLLADAIGPLWEDM